MCVPCVYESALTEHINKARRKTVTWISILGLMLSTRCNKHSKSHHLTPSKNKNNQTNNKSLPTSQTLHHHLSPVAPNTSLTGKADCSVAVGHYTVHHRQWGSRGPCCCILGAARLLKMVLLKQRWNRWSQSPVCLFGWAQSCLLVPANGWHRVSGEMTTPGHGLLAVGERLCVC